MAANIPSDPNSRGDDSHIFRRAKPKPPGAVPPLEEPTDLLDFGSDDDEDALGGVARPGTGESPSVIVRRGYREGSSVNLGGAGHTPGESGSSIFAHAESLAPSAPGSGWFDSIPPGAKSIPAGESPVVDDLFAGIDSSDSVAVPVSGWQGQQATNSVTESEVIRAFDNLSSRDVTERLGVDDALDYDATQPSGSHIFPDSSAAEIGFGDSSIDFDPSGVDLLNPERADSERLTGPRSSIFGAPSHKELTELDLGDESASGEDITENMLFSPPPDGGSSIFGKTTPQLAFPSDADRVAFSESVFGEGDQASGMVDWASKPLSGSMQPSMEASFDDDADVDPFTDEIEVLKSPAPKKRSGPVGTSGAGAVIAPAKPREFEEIEDEPIRAPKSKREPTRVKPLREPGRKSGGGILGWVGGGAVGLLVGAGAFAGLQFGGVLPGAEATKPALVQNAGPSAELTALEAKQDELKKELLAANDAAGRADAEKAKLEQSIRTARADLKTAKDDAAVTKKSLGANGEKLTLALAAVQSAKDDADAAQKEATKAAALAKEAGLATEAATAEAKLAKANADKSAADLDAANKAGADKTKLALAAEAVAAAAQKKLQSSEAGLGSIVKDLKANKLIDDALDAPAALALLPDVFKKLGTLAMSPDAKKAAEALLASKKELDASQAALKAAESAKVETDAKVLAAKKETDAVKKESDAKVLAAVDKATAEAKKSLADADAVKLALAAKQKVDAAALQTAHAQQLAEARQGGAIQITPAEVLNQDRAARDYHAGVQAFQGKKYGPASAALESAVKLDPADARYWYYLGLTLWELGRATEARAAFQKGSDLEARGKPNAGLVGDALERIQGEARRELNLIRR